ncbi:MAG: LysR family transcriptional regulator [Sphingobium sp.]
MSRPRPPAASIDLISLRLLLAVAAEDNLARAAQRENIALSAASRRISNLEARVGVQLLHRHDRGTTPTAAALSVLPRIQTVFDLLDQVLDDLAEVSDGTHGVIRIKAHTTAMTGRLPELVAEFLRQHPRIDIMMDEATSVEIMQAVSTGGCDMGFVGEAVAQGDLRLIDWLRDELVAIFPSSHPLSAQEQVSLADMLDYPFICMQKDSALVSLVRREAQALERPMTERAHVGSFHVACRMIAHGLGVGIIPRDALDASLIGTLEQRPLTDSWARRALKICVRQPHYQSKAVQMLLSFLLDHSSAEK